MALKTNIEKLVKAFEQFTIDHKFINHYGFGSVDLVGVNANNTSLFKYPLLWVVEREATFPAHTVDVTFDVIFCDLTSENLGNEKASINDQLRIAIDFYNTFKQASNKDYKLVGEPRLSSFRDRFFDNVAGWVMTITFEFANDGDRCAMPYVEHPNPSINYYTNAEINNFIQLLLTNGGICDVVSECITIQSIIQSVNLIDSRLNDAETNISANSVNITALLNDTEALDDRIGLAESTLSIQSAAISSLSSNKLDKNSPITSATGTKVTVDTKGLIVSIQNANTSDINDSTNRRYVTDSQLSVIQNTSGINTGNETATTIGAIVAGSSNSTLNDTDQLPVISSGIVQKSTWAAIKTALTTFFNSLFTPISRSINTTSPLTGGGTLATDRTISIPQATGSQNGYLASTDWTTFNNKLGSSSVLSISNIPEAARVYRLFRNTTSSTTTSATATVIFSVNLNVADLQIGSYIICRGFFSGTGGTAKGVLFRSNNDTTATIATSTVNSGQFEFHARYIGGVNQQLRFARNGIQGYNGSSATTPVDVNAVSGVHTLQLVAQVAASGSITIEHCAFILNY